MNIDPIAVAFLFLYLTEVDFVLCFNEFEIA